MSEGPEVKMASGNTGKNQWGKGIFTRLDGQKKTVDTKKLTYLSSAVFVFVLFFSLFQGADNQVVYESSVKVPENVGSIVSFEVPVVQEEPTGTSVSKRQRRRKKRTQFYAAPSLIARPGSLKVPPGTMIEAKLISGASNGLVRAAIVKPFSFEGETLLEKDTVLLGNGTSTEERLFIHFNRMVLKDGGVQSIRAQAYDHEDQTRGLKGSTIGNTTLKLLASVGLNFVGGMSEGLQENEVQGGVAMKKTNLKNALLNGATHAALDQSQEMMSSIKNEQPIIEVEAESKFYIIFEGK